MLDNLVDAFCAGEVETSKILFCLICFELPLRRPFLISSFGFWTKELHFGAYMHTSKQHPVFAGWHDVELYVILLRQCL